MTPDDMKKWLETATYKDLLRKIRFEPMGSIWFKGEIGDLFMKRYTVVKKETPVEDQVKASKEIGWR